MFSADDPAAAAAMVGMVLVLVVVTVGKATFGLNPIQLKEQVNNARMVVSPLWRGPGNIHGFVLDGKSYR